MSEQRFNVFAPASAPWQGEASADRQDARALLSPPTRDWLAARLARLRPHARYHPGDTLEAVAFRAGRIAALEELLALSDPERPA